MIKDNVNIPLSSPLINYNKTTNTWDNLIKVGSTNLIRNSSFDNKNPYDSFNNEDSILSYEGCSEAISQKCMKVEKKSADLTMFGFNQNINGLYYDGIYTISLLIKVTEATNIRCIIGGNVAIDTKIDTINEYVYLTSTFKISNKMSVYSMNLYGYTTNTMYVADIKLEEGNLATTWSKSPLDIQSSSGGLNIALGKPRETLVIPGNKTAYITWADPDDIIVDGITLCSWAKTTVVMKKDSPPQFYNDGTIIVESVERDLYRYNPLVVSVENDCTYYFRFYAYDTNENYYQSSSVVLKCKPTALAKNYTVKCIPTTVLKSSMVDTTKTTYQYLDLASTFKKAEISANGSSIVYNDWSDVIDMISPNICLFKDGKVNYYLDPSDITKRLDGVDADITSGKDGDVMVEFNKMAFSLKNDNITFSITNHMSAFDETSDYNKFFKGHNKMYVSAFDCCLVDNKFRSLYGKSPANVIPNKYPSYLSGGYSLISFDQYMYIYLLRMMILQNDAFIGKRTSNVSYNKPLKSGDSMGKPYNKFGEISLFNLENFSTNTQKFIFDTQIAPTNLPTDIIDFSNIISISSNYGIGLDPTYDATNKSSLNVKYHRDAKSSTYDALSIGINYLGFPTNDINDTTLMFSQTNGDELNGDIGYRIVYMV